MVQITLYWFKTGESITAKVTADEVGPTLVWRAVEIS